MTKAWRREKLPRRERVVSIIDTPMNRVTAAALENTSQSGWPTAASTTAGMTMAMARTVIRMPLMKRTGRSSITTVAPRLRGRARRSRFLRASARPC